MVGKCSLGLCASYSRSFVSVSWKTRSISANSSLFLHIRIVPFQITKFLGCWTSFKGWSSPEGLFILYCSIGRSQKLTPQETIKNISLYLTISSLLKNRIS
uniref:Uncharacterized protein n=1 Tax=Cacopsylla melanoneura TaxID=428564 RepID=A0A8D9E8U1_9HEMI